MQARKDTSEGSTVALKPRVDVARSPKQGISGPTINKQLMTPQKGSGLVQKFVNL